MNQEAEFYRVSEFCEHYVISRAGFYREVAAHRLSVIKRGRTTLITRVEAERWFQFLCGQSKSQQPA
jgi:hypothetical protein